MVVPVETLGQFAVELAKGSFPEERLFRNARLRELMMNNKLVL
jgi:hypothetical protein